MILKSEHISQVRVIGFLLRTIHHRPISVVIIIIVNSISDLPSLLYYTHNIFTHISMLLVTVAKLNDLMELIAKKK